MRESCIDALLERGAAVIHHARWSLLDHLLGVENIVAAWQQPHDVRMAALVHSVYTTDAFKHQVFAVEERPIVQQLVGDAAEHIAYLFCAVDRRELLADGPPRDRHVFGDRLGGGACDVTALDLQRLRILHLANAAEQVCAADGAPRMWLAAASALARSLSDDVVDLPPIFDRCTQVVSSVDEASLLESYATLQTSDYHLHRAAAANLESALGRCDVVAEPHVLLGLIALAAGRPLEAVHHGARARALLETWNAAWDKRLSPLAWLSLADLLSSVANMDERATSFLATRIERFMEIVGLDAAALHGRLAACEAFGIAVGETVVVERDAAAMAGFRDDRESLPPRFAEYALEFASFSRAADLLFYPSLASQPFHDPARFALARELERLAPDIRREFDAIDPRAFHEESERIKRIGDWSVFMLYERGKKNEANCAMAPITAAALDAHRVVKSLAGLVYFSRLAPRTRIAPHSGPTNMRLRCHLGLHVPQGCKLTVDGESRTWQEGRCLVFDDSFEHSAENLSGEPRVVLIVDLWHPELSDHEVALLHGLQSYIDQSARNLATYWSKNDGARRGLVNADG